MGHRYIFGHGVAMALVANVRAVERPDEIALRDDQVAMTWGQLNATLNRFVDGLGRLDLGPQRRVAVFASNSVETVIAHLGGLLAGASTVPINFHLNTDEVAYILRDSQSAVLFTDAVRYETAKAAAEISGLESVFCWGEQLSGGADSTASNGASSTASAGPASWEQFLADSADVEPDGAVAPRPNLMYTSGTTGFPKGVDLPPTIFAGGATIAEHLQSLAQSRFARYGTHLVVGPMYHTGPLSGMRILAAGTPIVVMNRFDAEQVLAAVQAYSVETTVMVPTHFKRLLGLPDLVRNRYDVRSMKLITHTGSACPIDVKREMIDWFGPVFMDAYGATEVGTICLIGSTEWLEHPGSVGRCVPPFTAVVVDEFDQPVPPGTEGKLYFEDATGRGIVYPNDPEKTAASHLRPGVFTIGEIGYVDVDGYVYITDRFSDMIVSGGANIYPAESEHVLASHPQIADVAVIGVPDADMGEAVKALIVAVDPADPPNRADLEAWCRLHLAGYKCPRSFDVVSTIGRNAMGKVNKRALRAPYWDATQPVASR